MRRKLLLFFVFLGVFSMISAQEGIRSFLYKGTVENMPVTLYLVEDTSGCGPKFYSGMYQYDKLSKWLYLEISDDESERMIMVEGGITGILSLKKTGKSLTGFWISPDGARKLVVNMKEIQISDKVDEKYRTIYDRLHYEWNDC